LTGSSSLLLALFPTCIRAGAPPTNPDTSPPTECAWEEPEEEEERRELLPNTTSPSNGVAPADRLVTGSKKRFSL
jgi:hypothetical protein